MKNREINTVLVTVPYLDGYMEKLKEALSPSKVLIVDRNDYNGISNALKEADVAILGSEINDQILNEGKKLKWIHCDQAGLNSSARPEVFNRGIILTGSAGRSYPVLAEHAFFLILSLIYDSKGLLRQQDKHIWGGLPDYNKRKGLFGKTIGIIGMGHTGLEVARLAKAFSMKVLGYGRTNRGDVEVADKMYYSDKGDTIDELLKNSDIVVMATSLNNETYHIINEYSFEIMKDSAFLINMARGLVVDEQALVNALRNETIAGAGSDTFEKEPLPSDSPLWEMDNMIITPHSTPGMPDMTARSLDIICENIKLYKEGKELYNHLSDKDVYTK